MAVSQLKSCNISAKKEEKHTCNKIKKALQLSIKRKVKGDDSETQSQVGWLKEVVVCVSSKLSPAIRAEVLTLGRFLQANNCSFPVGRRILYCCTIHMFKYYNFLSLNISINLYWYQLMTQVYAMIYILMKQAQDASNNNFSPEKRIRYRGMQAKRRISRRICLSCWTTFCQLVIVGQTE